jgi:hypothetical protein
VLSLCTAEPKETAVPVAAAGVPKTEKRAAVPVLAVAEVPKREGEEGAAMSKENGTPVVTVAVGDGEVSPKENGVAAGVGTAEAGPKEKGAAVPVPVMTEGEGGPKGEDEAGGRLLQRGGAGVFAGALVETRGGAGSQHRSR